MGVTVQLHDACEMYEWCNICMCIQRVCADYMCMSCTIHTRPAIPTHQHTKTHTVVSSVPSLSQLYCATTCPLCALAIVPVVGVVNAGVLVLGVVCDVWFVLLVNGVRAADAALRCLLRARPFLCVSVCGVGG